MAVTRTKLVRMNPDLSEQIEKAIGSIKERNLPKYSSVPEFVERACINLLNEEGIK